MPKGLNVNKIRPHRQAVSVIGPILLPTPGRRERERERKNERTKERDERENASKEASERARNQASEEANENAILVINYNTGPGNAVPTWT